VTDAVSPPEPGALRAGGPLDPLEASPADIRTWRIFGSSLYFRLWLAQVVSSIGDWIGLVAILSIAAGISDRPEAAISLVMVARMLPGFLLAPVGGVVADRLDRRRLMVFCDLGRAATVASLPFITTLPMLFVASFVLEVFSLLWTPAKDASIPNLVPADRLVAANSLGMVAGFGTFPIGAALFASLAAVADRLDATGWFTVVQINQEFLALWLDSLTFVTSAVLIMTLSLPRKRRASAPASGRIDWAGSFRDLREGMRFIASQQLVRAVMLGLGAGLLGGAAVIPLGPVYVEQVLGGGSAGFGLLMTGMGVGAAVGVITLSTVGRLFPREFAFLVGLVGSGLCILVVASMNALGPAVAVVGLFGLSAGSGYVAGFTLLHENVSDAMRGRAFAALYTLIRLTIVVSLTIWPLASGFLDGLSRRWVDREVDIFGVVVAVPGVRLAIWLGAVIVIVAGVLAGLDVRRARRAAEALGRHPANDAAAS
jgi:dTMP kinase